MYRNKNREKQVEKVKISLEKLVPENHILSPESHIEVHNNKSGRYTYATILKFAILTKSARRQ